MKFSTLSCFVALFANLACLHGATGTTIKRDISELTSFEKVLLYLSHPEVYETWFPKGQTPFAEHIVSDVLLFDFTSLVLQLTKSADSIRIPSLDYVYQWYFCYMGICAGFRQDYAYIEPELKNAHLNTFNTKLNATNFELDLQIPDMQIVMPKFTLRDEDLVTHDLVVWRGFTIAITNYTLQFSGNLEYIPDVGIQISNVSMNFGVGELYLRKHNATHTNPDGTNEEWGEVSRTFEEYMNEGWTSIREDVTLNAEIRLNCFLSNGRNGHEACPNLFENKVVTENFVQFLQNIGLGMAIQEQRENNKVAEVKNTKFAAESSFSQIRPILLELPTLLLQVGKLMYDPIYNYIPVEFFPFSYDFIREDCPEEGVCRSVHEHMTLASYGFGGLSDNSVEFDIQPNNFSYWLKVPSAYFDSELFQHETTYLESGLRHMYLGLNLTVANAAFAVAGDYEYEQGVGIQISNLSLTLLLGELQIRVPQYVTVENGESSEVGEYKKDIASEVMSLWREVDEDGVRFERRYEEYVQNLINAHLSGQS